MTEIKVEKSGDRDLGCDWLIAIFMICITICIVVKDFIR